MAVKCLAKDKLKTQMAEFLLEAANMCSIDHAHIVQLYGVVLSSDSLMLVNAFTVCKLNFTSIVLLVLLTNVCCVISSDTVLVAVPVCLILDFIPIDCVRKLRNSL